jgi:hypothetical protein
MNPSHKHSGLKQIVIAFKCRDAVHPHKYFTRKEIEKGKLSDVNEQSAIQALQKNIACKNSN